MLVDDVDDVAQYIPLLTVLVMEGQGLRREKRDYFFYVWLGPTRDAYAETWTT